MSEGFQGSEWLRVILGLLIVLGFSQFNALFLVWLERKVAGHIQLRPGPMEVGPHGLLQSVMDGVKLVGKELILPLQADKRLFFVAPVMVFMPVLVGFLVLFFKPLQAFLQQSFYKLRCGYLVLLCRLKDFVL